MRVALISDLHANLVAVDAVLADARRRGVDQIVCLGDVATLGPHPREVLARLRDLDGPTILANHDEFLFHPALLDQYTEAPIIHAAVAWCRDQLTAAELDELRGFVPERTITAGGASLHLFHGTPRSHMENLLATTPGADVDAMLAGRTATVLAGGHTHLPLVRQHHAALIVNPGSVGLAIREFVDGGPPRLLDHAQYAIVELAGGRASVTSIQVDLDRAALRRAATAVAHPLREMLAAAYA
ncbi:MAG: metallophosphoesterase family protein [Myxococcales bacterium]|nr:metallophosphoesterase family protein [Myxococcales bacterium]